MPSPSIGVQLQVPQINVLSPEVFTVTTWKWPAETAQLVSVCLRSVLSQKLKDHAGYTPWHPHGIAMAVPLHCHQQSNARE